MEERLKEKKYSQVHYCYLYLLAATVFSPTVTNVHYNKLSIKYLIWSILKNIGIVLFKSLGNCKRRNKRFYLYNVNALVSVK